MERFIDDCAGFPGQKDEAVSRPMQTILAILDCMQDESIVCTPEEQALYLRYLRKSSLEMMRCIRNMDDAAMPAALTLERRPQNITALIGGIYRQARPSVERACRELLLEGDHEPAYAAIAPEELERILGNLISNAVKASERCAAVTIFTERQERCIRVGVRDHGVGMTPEKLAAITGDSDASGHRGLDACRRILFSMGIALNGESAPGEGCRLWFDLPLVMPEEQLSCSSAGRVLRFPGISMVELELSVLDIE